MILWWILAGASLILFPVSLYGTFKISEASGYWMMSLLGVTASFFCLGYGATYLYNSINQRSDLESQRYKVISVGGADYSAVIKKGAKLYNCRLAHEEWTFFIKDPSDCEEIDSETKTSLDVTKPEEIGE